MEQAYGEKREEALRIAGLKTYFITKVLKPVRDCLRQTNTPVKEGNVYSSTFIFVRLLNSFILRFSLLLLLMLFFYYQKCLNRKRWETENRNNETLKNTRWLRMHRQFYPLNEESRMWRNELICHFLLTAISQEFLCETLNQKGNIVKKTSSLLRKYLKYNWHTQRSIWLGELWGKVRKTLEEVQESLMFSNKQNCSPSKFCGKS